MCVSIPEQARVHVKNWGIHYRFGPFKLFYSAGKPQRGLLHRGLQPCAISRGNYASYFGLEWIARLAVVTAELSKSDGEVAFHDGGEF